MVQDSPVALITGAARGIGRAVAEALARDGHRLALADRDASALAETANALAEAGYAEVEMLVGDISRWSVPLAWAQQVNARWGRLDVLVNNAGLFEYGFDFDTIDEKRFDAMFGVNIKGLFRMTQAAVGLMLPRGAGRIVSLASGAALAGSGMKAAHYAASKGAVVALSRSLAREYGPRGICANTVSPGAVDTRMTADFGAEQRGVYAATNPLGRMASPAEIAEVVAFLAGARASYVNGQTVSVCGGAITY